VEPALRTGAPISTTVPPPPLICIQTEKYIPTAFLRWGKFSCGAGFGERRRRWLKDHEVFSLAVDVKWSFALDAWAKSGRERLLRGLCIRHDGKSCSTFLGKNDSLSSPLSLALFFFFLSPVACFFVEWQPFALIVTELAEKINQPRFSPLRKWAENVIRSV
jgi:hypothetical protein